MSDNWCPCGADLQHDPWQNPEHRPHLEALVAKEEADDALWAIQKSPYFGATDTFLKKGDRVRAKRRVYDLPGNRDPRWWSGTYGPVAAEVGEEGECIDVQKDHWPTVKFPQRKRITDVTDFEVEKI